MEVILLERIEKLGQMGDVVTVKNGYARNYLLPRKKALRATEESRKHFDTQRVQLEANNLEARQEAETVAERMAGLSVVMVRQAGDTGQLYGSVSARDIAAGVSAAGFTVNRRQISLDRVIKTLGLHTARIALHPEVAVEITVNAARSEQEAKLQAAGIDVNAMDDDFDEFDDFDDDDKAGAAFDEQARPRGDDAEAESDDAGEPAA